MTSESANRDNDNNNNNGDQNIDRGPIVSALLTFDVSIYASHDRIIQLLMSEFGIDEIKQSKHILCGVSNVPYQNRNPSNLRSE